MRKHNKKISKNRTQNTRRKTHLVEGVISINQRGVGYVTTKRGGEDIQIDPQLVNTALHQDVVKVRLFPRKKGERQKGEVVEIITRNKTMYVGTLEKGRDFFLLNPDDRKMHLDIIVPFTEAKGALGGDKVLAEITYWGTKTRREPAGKVLEVIGKAGDNDVEMKAILLDKGLSPEFPSYVEHEAKKIQEHAKRDLVGEIEKRKDFRNVTTFTIDPKSAKDFDDAISVEELPDGSVRIGVHIADVTHYVREGTEIDKEAIKRGTSIYLVDRTIPMLPEALSNDLCSLNPEEEKLVFSALFTFAPLNGDTPRIIAEWFGKGIIRSDKRFVYEEAQQVLDNGSGSFYTELALLNTIAKKLRQDREEQGSISFEHEEVGFELDENGKPIAVTKKIIQDTNKLVEEFMLLANKKVAEYIERITTKKERVFIYRIHDDPDREKIHELIFFLKRLGHDVEMPKTKITSKEINKILKKVEGSPEETMVQTAAIRSMAKAIYSTKNIGHYGLAFEHYTHFTSPIRRYPDMMVHRLLKQYLQKKKVPAKKFEEYAALADHTSQMEKVAMDAERTSVKFKQVEYMQGKIGQEFEGIISGVTEWGIYVEEKTTKAEGLIRLKDLADDYYTFDQGNFCLVGKEKKKTYRLGDAVRMKVAQVNLEDRTIDYALA